MKPATVATALLALVAVLALLAAMNRGGDDGSSSADVVSLVTRSTGEDDASAASSSSSSTANNNNNKKKTAPVTEAAAPDPLRLSVSRSWLDATPTHRFNITLRHNAAASHIQLYVVRSVVASSAAPPLNGSLGWRARVVGPLVKLLHFQPAAAASTVADIHDPDALAATGADAWVADANLECAGMYTLHVLSEFDDYVDVADRINLRHVLPVPAVLPADADARAVRSGSIIIASRGVPLVAGALAAASTRATSVRAARPLCSAAADRRLPECTTADLYTDTRRLVTRAEPGSWVVVRDREARYLRTDAPPPAAGTREAAAGVSNNTLSEAATLACLRNRNATRPTMQSLRGRDVYEPSPACAPRPFSSAFSRLEYRYARCQIPEDAELGRRLLARADKRPLCVSGDSQDRNLFNEMVRILEPNNTAAKVTGVIQDVCTPTFMPIFYEMPPYYDKFNGMCAAMMLNFGQWPLSYSSGLTNAAGEKRPMSEAEYYDAMNDFFGKIAARVANYTSRVFWISTNAHPHSEPVVNGRDWRSLFPTRAYNAIARRLCTKWNIPMIDTHEMAQTLVELSFDGAHYMAPVERELARMSLHFYLTKTKEAEHEAIAAKAAAAAAATQQR